jgi:hypothetical protein
VEGNEPRGRLRKMWIKTLKDVMRSVLSHAMQRAEVYGEGRFMVKNGQPR